MLKDSLAVTLLSLAGLAVFVPDAGAQPPARAVPAQVLVQFRPGVSDAQAQAVINAHQGRSVRQIPQIRVHMVALPAAGTEAAFAQAFKNRPEVLGAEVNRLVPHADLVPNDPFYPSQWHLAKIQGPAAWSVTAGSTSVIVAVLDTGVDGTHPDLSPKMVAGWNIYDNNSDSRDVYGHGTKVAGTVAAAGNNSTGVASVAWGCWIMPVRISDPTGWATYSNIASGLVWAADHGARVANISYKVTTSSTITAAAQYFQGQGGVVTSSAGNDAIFDASADNPYIITVSATDPNDALYSWSSTGNNVDVAAPGCVYTTFSGGGYGSACGTSFSAPIAAGVAALVLSVKPLLSPGEVTSVLRSSADDLGTAGWDASFGAGRVNAARAVAQAGGGSPPPAADIQRPSVAFTSPAAGATVSNTVTLAVSASDNVGVTSVTIAVDGATTCLFSAAPFSCSWNTKNVVSGAHTLTATAKDAAGNLATASVTVTVSNAAADTTLPTVTITSPKTGNTVSGNVTVTVSYSDNVGVVRVELAADGTPTATATSAPFTTRWNSQKALRGTHTLQVKAFDAAGNYSFSPAITVSIAR